MLNILIAKMDSSRDIISEILNWDEGGEWKLRAVDNFAKVSFKNLHDIDFIIVDTKTLLSDDSKMLLQLEEKNLTSKIILIGQEKNYTKLSYIIKNGIKCYEPDINNVPERLLEIFRKKVKEKEHEIKLGYMINDGLTIKKVKQALENEDTRLLQKIFASGNKLLPAPIGLLKEYFSQIIQTVFEFAEEKGVRHIDKNEIISNIMGFTDYESVRDYTIKKMTGLIHLAEVNKKDHKNMLAEYIKSYIDENYMKQDTNAGNIADRVGVSSSYIGSLFREQEKTTITKYITQLRIAKAAELLSDTKLQIQSISKKVGYSDQNYFARIFKKQTGLSPGEYRSKSSH